MGQQPDHANITRLFDQLEGHAARPGWSRPQLLLRVAIGVVLAVGAVVVLWWSIERPDDGASRCLVALQFAGDRAGWNSALEGPCAHLGTRGAAGAASASAAGDLAFDAHARATVDRWLLWDAVAAVLYGLGLGVLTWVGVHLSRAPMRTLAGLGVTFAAFAASADLLENLVTVVVLRTTLVAGSGGDALLPVMGGAALLKWSALLPALLISVIVVATAVVRAAAHDAHDGHLEVDHRGSAPAEGGAATPPSTAAGGTAGSSWRDHYHVPVGTPQDPGAGLCLSGGGARAATFGLGAVQAVQAAGRLTSFRYLAAVSGGAYHAMAHQLVRTRWLRSRPGGSHPEALVDPYLPGTPEEDHRRRHTRYLADGAGGWLVAIGIVLRNVLLSVSVIGALLLIAAQLQGLFYAALGSWAVDTLTVCDDCPGLRVPLDAVPTVASWVWMATSAPLVVGLAMWIWTGAVRPRASTTPPPGSHDAPVLEVRRRRTMLSRLAGALALLSVTAAALFLVGPLLVYLGSAAGVAVLTGATGAGVASGGVLVTVLTTIWGLLAGGDGDRDEAASRLRRAASKLPFLSRLLVTLAVVAGLIAVALLSYAALLRTSVQRYVATGSFHPVLDTWPLWFSLALLLLLTLVFDQTRMSLHPFYKRRLSTAYVVERTTTGQAREIDFDEVLRLSSHAGRTPDGDGALLPELLVCAAANVSGTPMAPAGRRVTPYVFSASYVGGPRLGYVRTSQLEALVEDRAYAKDLTLVGATAVSGAAVASAMGKLSGPFNVLLALTNSRLGAWLPNPAYHFGASTGSPQQQWLRPPCRPQVRRLPYWFREIFGSYPSDIPFVYVTDGGHYENLGLLELLRRRCNLILCIDASADHDLRDLTDAVLQAREELGVRIELPDLADLRPHPPAAGPGGGLDTEMPSSYAAQLAAAGRLARSCVTVGSYRYPEHVAGTPRGPGRLVVARAVLTPQMPVELLAHAVRNRHFPNDPTADQWFDIDRFEAYRQLGAWIGERADAAMSRGSATADG